MTRTSREESSSLQTPSRAGQRCLQVDSLRVLGIMFNAAGATQVTAIASARLGRCGTATGSFDARGTSQRRSEWLGSTGKQSLCTAARYGRSAQHTAGGSTPLSSDFSVEWRGRTPRRCGDNSTIAVSSLQCTSSAATSSSSWAVRAFRAWHGHAAPRPDSAAGVVLS